MNLNKRPEEPIEQLLYIQTCGLHMDLNHRSEDIANKTH